MRSSRWCPDVPRGEPLQDSGPSSRDDERPTQGDAGLLVLLVGRPEHDQDSARLQTLNGCCATNAAAGPRVKKFGLCVAGIRDLISAWNFA